MKDRDYWLPHAPFTYTGILSSQVVSLPLQSVDVANFCAAMDTLIDQDATQVD